MTGTGTEKNEIHSGRPSAPVRLLILAGFFKSSHLAIFQGRNFPDLGGVPRPLELRLHKDSEHFGSRHGARVTAAKNDEVRVVVGLRHPGRVEIGDWSAPNSVHLVGCHRDADSGPADEDSKIIGTLIAIELGTGKTGNIRIIHRLFSVHTHIPDCVALAFEVFKVK